MCTFYIYLGIKSKEIDKLIKIIKSKKIPGSCGSAGDSCRSLVMRINKNLRYEGGICVISYLRFIHQIKHSNLPLEKNVPAHPCSHVSQTTSSLGWMLALYLEHISFIKQVSWLTDHRMVPPSHILGLCNGCWTYSLITVTSSLGILTQIPFSWLLINLIK